MKKTDRNSILFVATAFVFMIIAILSTNVSAKSVEGIALTQTSAVEDNSISDQAEVPTIVISSEVAQPEIIQADATADPEPTSEVYLFENTGYSTTISEIRTAPSLVSGVWGHYLFNQELHYSDYDNTWAVVDWNGQLGYVSKFCISSEIQPYTSKPVINDKKKTFESHTVFSSKTPQGVLQQKAVTSPSGIRIVDGRYCVAVGSYFSKNIGQYMDVVLANGVVIPCILGDGKSDVHTSADNSIGLDGSCVEFIVDMNSLDKNAKKSGDCSNCNPLWASPVVEIRVYNNATLL